MAKPFLNPFHTPVMPYESGNDLSLSRTSKMWLGLFRDNWLASRWDECFALSAMLRFGDPFQLTWGSNAVGTLQSVERREIVPSFRDMIGLPPVSDVFLSSTKADLP